MDVSQYQTDSLVGLRELTNGRAKLAVAPIDPISAKQTQPEQTAEGEGFSVFETLLDTVNPLQHIPGVSSAYQAVTGDTSNSLAEMAGGFLFGGTMGLAAGAANSFFEMLTGKSFADHAMAFFSGAEDGTETPADGGLTEIETADAQSLESLVKPTADPLGIEQYQAFAAAHAEKHLGIGADARDVSWASNMWTDSALQKVSGLYETSQNLNAQKQKSVQTLV